jgi:hypothetical protein
MTTRRRGLFAGVVVLCYAASLSSAGEWTVDGPIPGALVLSASAAGRVTGTFAGEPVDGLLVHRHLVLLRTTPEGPELWDGWLSPDASRIGGTVTLSTGEQQPWSARRADTGSNTVVVPPPRTASPTPPPPRPTPTPAPPTAAAPVAQPLPPDTARVAGRWQTPTGSAHIRQEGRRLEVDLPDGRTVGGRITGEASLVAGLRLGCCRATLEGTDRIRWEDGAVWIREQ